MRVHLNEEIRRSAGRADVVNQNRLARQMARIALPDDHDEL